MRPAALLVLTFLLPFATARAEDEMRPRFFEISRATVMASPGAPSGLHTFLPRGEAPKPLRWPLPKGPVLVLGLPETDPAAREIAEAFGIDVDPGALGGGYRIDAWRDGRRALVFIFASDAAALFAARFEFDDSAPSEMMDPEARSLDFKKPNQQAGLIVRAGRRVVKPRYRLRAFRPRSMVSELAAGSRGNREWLRVKKIESSTAAEMRALGLEPVMVGGPDHVKRLLRAQKLGVRHFALVVPADFQGDEGKAAREIAAALRPGGLAELTVVPRGYCDRLAAKYPPPDVRAIPEAVIAWSGPEEHSIRITRADAERRVAEAGVPVVLYDTWAEPFNRNEAYVPVQPYGRDPDLHEVLDGVVVVGTRGTTTALESAWAPVEEDPFGAQLLGPLLPSGGDDAQTFLTKAAMRIEKEVEETMGLVPWMKPLAQNARTRAKEIHDGTAAVAVPVVPSHVVLDGRIDEPAWGFARSIPTGRNDAKVLALSDGRSLYLAVRLRRAPSGVEPATLGFGIVVSDDPRSVGGAVSSGGAVCFEKLTESSAHARAAHRASGTEDVAEFVFDRFALAGEAHPLRVFDFSFGFDSKPMLLVVTR